MDHAEPCDTNDMASHTTHDTPVGDNEAPSSESPCPGKGEAASNSVPKLSVAEGVLRETDPGTDWRASQQVEEDDNVSSLPSVDDSPTQESIVRRRKGKSEEPTTTITTDTTTTTKAAQDTLQETHQSLPDSPDALKKQEKINEVREVLSSEKPNLEKLKELAISSGGLLDDDLRKKAWPLLMGLRLDEAEESKPEMEVVQGHRDYQQVVLDVKRTLKRFPPGIDDDRRLVLMDQLIMLIIRVLMRHPDLYYYQGYHDVAITFLLVTGEDMGFQLVEKLSVTHLRDFMQPTMEKTNYYLTYLYPILENTNPPLHQCLEKSGVGTVFCLPWLITWFAHTLSDYRHVVRLYDFFLASPDLMPMYIATAIVLQKEEELLADTEGEVASVFSILSKDPDNLPFEDILVKATELYHKDPPDTLTERVEKIIVRREEFEKMEKQRIEEMRKKAESFRYKKPGLMNTVMAYLPALVVPARRHSLIKIFLFTASIIIAHRLYKKYYTSAIELVIPE